MFTQDKLFTQIKQDLSTLISMTDEIFESIVFLNPANNEANELSSASEETWGN